MSYHSIHPEKVFYHGTDAVFDIFDANFKGSNTCWENTLHGFFFADKKENALLFGNTLIHANLRIQQPIDLRIHSIFSDLAQASVIWEIVSGECSDNKTALKILNNEISLGEIEELFESLYTQGAHELMVQKGYDAIISNMGNNQNEYVVFNTDQITIKTIEHIQNRGFRR